MSGTMPQWRASSRRSRPSAQHAKRTGPETKPKLTFRLHRVLLQSKTQALDYRLYEPCGVRDAGRISLGTCQLNRVQAISPCSFSYLLETLRGRLRASA